jgi:branched-chain amino acid transport system substrate-binding protein
MFSGNIYSAEKKYSIYIDADFTGTRASSQSIQQGINTALAEVDYTIDGYTFTVIVKDHRANSIRSKRNLERFLQDETALLIFSGLHSPPLLSNKKFINNKGILLLDPWAAAGPITRSNQKENWIFRLSIDDSNAGTYIVKRAIQEGFKNLYLLLEDTGWGKSNERTMSLALAEKGVKVAGTTWFNWGVGKNHAKLILRNIKQAGADGILFVGNTPEGKVFSKAMIELPESIRLPIRSHWGITGADFHQVINREAREKLDLQFIQTNYSFLHRKLSIFENAIFDIAKKNNKQITRVSDIKAQTGFVHSYDLTKLLIAAIKQVGLTGNRTTDKLAIRNALIDLHSPVKGLLKTYNKPFSKYSINNRDAHEALTIDDYTMGYFGDDNEIVLVNPIKE